MNTHSPDMHAGQRGLTLLVVVLFLAAIAVLGVTVYTMGTVDLHMSGNYKHSVDALYQAEAGVQYVLGRVRKGVEDETLSLNGSAVPVNFSAPASFDFDPVTRLYQLADGQSYLYRVTGHGAEAQVTVEAVIRNEEVTLPIGVFGDRRISMGPGVSIYSYNSDTTMNPTLADNTDQATAGTNDEMGGGSDACHGTIYLGEDLSGHPATYPGEITSIAEVIRQERIDPDPLGAAGGPLAAVFDYVADHNDNASANGGSLDDGVLTIDANTLLHSGDYYVDEIDLDNWEELHAVANDGPVNIYLTGPAYTSSKAKIITTPQKPTNLRVFSNSGASIQFQPDSELHAFIYAPFAALSLQPKGHMHGRFWAQRIGLQPGGYIFMDNADIFSMRAGPPQLVSWKQVGN